MAAVLAGCATRPVNPPLAHFDPNTQYRFDRRDQDADDRQNLVDGTRTKGAPKP